MKLHGSLEQHHHDIKYTSFSGYYFQGKTIHYKTECHFISYAILSYSTSPNRSLLLSWAKALQSQIQQSHLRFDIDILRTKQNLIVAQFQYYFVRESKSTNSIPPSNQLIGVCGGQAFLVHLGYVLRWRKVFSGIPFTSHWRVIHLNLCTGKQGISVCQTMPIPLMRWQMGDTQTLILLLHCLNQSVSSETQGAIDSSTNTPATKSVIAVVAAGDRWQQQQLIFSFKRIVAIFIIIEDGWHQRTLSQKINIYQYDLQI